MAKKQYLDLTGLTTYDEEIKAHIDEVASGKANSSHNHAASNITSGTLSSDRLPTVPLTKGGTGGTDAGTARTNLSVYSKSEVDTKLNGKANSTHTHDNYLPLTGGTVTGTTVFSKVQDSAADSYNAPAVVVGGMHTTYHLELDNNEIQAKQNETKAGNLFLNSNGGTVHVGFDGLKMDSESSIIPEYALSSSVGTADLPFNRVFGRYYELYGAENTQYGRFRVGTTGTANTAGVVSLELGNATATGNAHNASGKITMYGSGTGFTNILPNTKTSGSNSVYLPSVSGTLATVEQSTKTAMMTTAEYTALETKDANTLYMLTDVEDDDESYVTQSDMESYIGQTFLGGAW